MSGGEASSDDIDDVIRRMPKAELHIHLEGTVRPATLLTLAERHGVRLPAEDEASLRDFYAFRDFDHFVEVWDQINACLCTPDDFALITRELGEEAASQNIRYLEVTVSPGTHVQHRGLTYSEVFDGIAQGARESAERWGVEMRFIVDIVRDHSRDQQWRTARWAVSEAAQRAGVVALGLGGTEQRFPPEPCAEIFDFALSHGLHSAPHAGETAGPESIRGAVRTLGAERIGHGIRAIDDSALMEELIEREIVLDVCPTSNICTGAVSSLAEHPIRQLFDAGIRVTLNTDDPPMFNTTLTDEYRLLAQQFDFSIEELMRVSLDAVRSSFLDAHERLRLEREFTEAFDNLRID